MYIPKHFEETRTDARGGSSGWHLPPGVSSAGLGAPARLASDSARIRSWADLKLLDLSGARSPSNDFNMDCKTASLSSSNPNDFINEFYGVIVVKYNDP
jgi:hypothetical protein